MAQPIQIYLGAPQTTKLPVYDGKGQQVTIKQLIFANTTELDTKITVTVNTIDIMKGFVVKAGETRVIDATIVLNPNDRLSLQQEKENAINVMINGVAEASTTISYQQ
ncbi:hypothetical protein CN575_02365 [Bacillus wiedmannii]|uniref:hypothetical protein n=1 Tax=Bacillus wiedmannii TaxID=1890302 RepID=UPI000BF0778A|nr:hypothetical protein [Bacillus wiedmannii]PEL95843.1 hypothetical protein CN604_25035 [Bacillus wiedmannii]PEP36634.1 hypothetical protein CN575_02365 [Bacillus wiedmannii]